MLYNLKSAMKILRYLLYAVAAVILIAGAAFAYLYFRSPATAPPASIKVDATPERVARGRYLSSSPTATAATPLTTSPASALPSTATQRAARFSR